jgi:hypothetical protein
MLSWFFISINPINVPFMWYYASLKVRYCTLYVDLSSVNEVFSLNSEGSGFVSNWMGSSLYLMNGMTSRNVDDWDDGAFF